MAGKPMEMSQAQSIIEAALRSTADSLSNSASHISTTTQPATIVDSLVEVETESDSSAGS